MSDLPNRLRQYEPEDISMAGLRTVIREAAAEIERLERALDEARAEKTVALTVAAAEREACAKLAGEMYYFNGDAIAAKIRARGNPR